MAKGPKQVQVVFDFPVKGLDTNWARHDQPPLTSPLLLNVLPHDLDRRARGAKRGGFSVLTGAAVGSVAATYRQARECISGTFAGIYVPTTDIGEYPYGFLWSTANGGDGGCYEIRETDDPTETPSGTIVAAVARTSIEDCDDSLCSETYPPGPPPPAATTYRRVRNCFFGGSFTSFVVIAPTGTFLNVGVPVSFHYSGNNQCYKVQTTDPLLTSITGLTLIDAGDITVIGDCTSDELCTGEGGTLEYYPLLSCDDDTPTGDYVEESATTPPAYYIPYDDECNPVYVASDAVAVTEIGDARVMSAGSGQLLEIPQCDEGDIGWFIDPPATIDVTLAGVLLSPPFNTCYAAEGGAGEGLYRKVTAFSINGTYTLPRDGVTSTYRGTGPAMTIVTYTDSGCAGVYQTNTTVSLEVTFGDSVCTDGTRRKTVQVYCSIDDVRYEFGGANAMMFSGILENISNFTASTFTVDNGTDPGFSSGTGPFFIATGGTATVEGLHA